MYGLTTLQTGISPDRLGVLISYSWMVSEKPGAYAEFGVMRGGSLDLLSALHPTKVFYGIDSFEGLPAPGANDIHVKGDFALSEEEYFEIKNYFSFRNVHIIKGFSPHIFRLLPDTVFAFAHIDVDMESSVKDALDFFYPRMSHGGVMIFDDYGFDSTPGAKKAIDEFVCDCSFRGEVMFINGAKTGQYVIVK